MEVEVVEEGEQIVRRFKVHLPKDLCRDLLAHVVVPAKLEGAVAQGIVRSSLSSAANVKTAVFS